MWGAHAPFSWGRVYDWREDVFVDGVIGVKAVVVARRVEAARVVAIFMVAVSLSSSMVELR